jgi:hypothetical protein
VILDGPMCDPAVELVFKNSGVGGEVIGEGRESERRLGRWRI